MGEMADFYVERMSNGYIPKRIKTPPTCKYCDTIIRWEFDGKGWIPTESDGKRHWCNYKTEDEFEGL